MVYKGRGETIMQSLGNSICCIGGIIGMIVCLIVGWGLLFASGKAEDEAALAEGRKG